MKAWCMGTQSNSNWHLGRLYSWLYWLNCVIFNILDLKFQNGFLTQCPKVHHIYKSKELSLAKQSRSQNNTLYRNNTEVEFNKHDFIYCLSILTSPKTHHSFGMFSIILNIWLTIQIKVHPQLWHIHLFIYINKKINKL